MKEKKKFILRLSPMFLLVVLVFVFSVRSSIEISATKQENKRQAQEKEILIKKQVGINLEKNLEEIEGLIRGKDLNKIKIKVKEIEQDYQQVVKDLSETRDFLKDKKVNPKVLARLDEFEKRYKEDTGNLVNNLSKAKKLNDFQKELAKIEDINQKSGEKSYEEVQNPRPFKVTGDGKVIKEKVSKLKTLSPPEIKDLNLEKRDNQTESKTTSAVGQVLSPTSVQSMSIPPEYLAEGEEIEFSQSIRNLADSLDKDPLKILNYVKNNIDYVPYYGIKKGSDATLIERAGNDFDQSALLIALLRYSGYPAKYERGQIKLSLNQVMNLLGVEDPIVAAKLLSKTHIPYTLYVDQNDEPLFFVIEHTWVEAYISYDYTRGLRQDSNPENKMWVVMEPSLKTVYYSQLVDIIDEMGFNVSAFYENYLQGNYGQQKPLEAYRQEITNYLSANHPDLIYEDILTKNYKQTEKLEFIPNTLPYEIVDSFGKYSQAPENLKHKVQFKITNKESGLELLNYTAKIHNIADKQMVLTYVAASPEDQQVINQYNSIYDIVPLSLVHMKPVVKVQGQVVAGGQTANPEIQLGKKEDLIMRFLVPTKEGGQLAETEEDKIEKEMIVGNDEGIAINTDRIALPELRPTEDTQTAEFLSSQKLYRTALNYLDRLQRSHKELAESLGGEFTNAATRAIVFNGIEVNYQGGEPYSFSWKGLRIDSSATVHYFSHFGSDIKRNQTRFMRLFGLEASLNESSIFEEDFNIEAMSAVKGLRMINQGQIPGVSAVKITSANRSVIDTLNVSEQTKTKFRTSVDAGNIIYTASQQYTYGNFTGLVYIDLDPITGSAGYIIGEGLNGGYTVGEWSLWWKTLWQIKVLTNITANFLAPTEGQEFWRGVKIGVIISYTGIINSQPNTWTEMGTVDSYYLPAGDTFIRAAYGTNTIVRIRIKGRSLGRERNEYDHIIFQEAETFGIDSDLLKSLIHQESINEHYQFYKDAYRYEPCIDYNYFSGSSPSIGMSQEPYSHYTIPGKNLAGNTIPQGDKIPSLNPSYRKMVKEGALVSRWALKFDDNNPDITLTELWENNNDIQNWSRFIDPDSNWCKDLLTSSNRNFTVQFLLTGSYGLGQVLYQTAIEMGFNGEKPNRSMYELFTPEIGIHYGAKYLKYWYDRTGNWREAVKKYNGAEWYAVEVYDKRYSSNLYDFIIEE